MRERILVTGTAGRIGPNILPLLRKEFALRLFDLNPAAPVEDDEVVRGDIADMAALQRACEGVRAMVHLAAVSDEDDFMTRLLPANLVGLYNAFEAARLAGVKKVLFASTGQTVLFYPKGEWITPEMLPRPWTVYACTKLFGEAMARLYSDRHGMSMIVLRICFFKTYDDPGLRVTGSDLQREWVSPPDLAQLMVKAIRADVKFGIYFGVSDNRGRFWDISNGERELGFRPVDDASRFLGASS
jgi:uronate dehydrogenase